MDDIEPFWKRVLLNELFLTGVAAVLILFVAFKLATGSEKRPEDDKPVRVTRP